MASGKDGKDPPGVATGILSLYHGDRKVGEGRIETQPGNFELADEGLCAGRDSGAASPTTTPANRPTGSPAPSRGSPSTSAARPTSTSNAKPPPCSRGNDHRLTARARNTQLLRTVSRMPGKRPSAWNGSWDGVPDNPRTTSAIRAMIRGICARRARDA